MRTIRIYRRFWSPALLEEVSTKVIALGAERLFATDNGGRQLFEWKQLDAPDLWNACLDLLGGGAVLAPYVIRYPAGVELRPHSDSGCMRLIALVRTSGPGGQLFIEGAPALLDVGDAAVFQDDMRHEVTKVMGERWTITMGAKS